MKRVFITILAIFAVLVFAYILWPDNERARSVSHERSGRTSVGQVFGVRVGMRWSQADNILRAQFSPRYVLWQPPGSEGPVLTGPASVSYRDTTGVITLELSDGHVRTIVWSYPGKFYIDL